METANPPRFPVGGSPAPKSGSPDFGFRREDINLFGDFQ